MSWMGRWGGHLQEGSLYVLLLLVPFSIATVEIAFGVLLAGWLMARCDPATRAQTLWGRRRLLPLTLAVGAYLAVCALSIAVSTNPALSARALFTKWFEYLLFFLMAADAMHTRPGLQRRACLVLIGSACLVVLEGITQELWGVGLLRHRVLYAHRMCGPYSNPIDLATYLMVIIPILFGYLQTLQPKARRALWVLLALLLMCLARTEALGAWLGFGVGLLVILSLERRLLRPMAILLAFFVIAGGLVLHATGRLQDLTSPLEIGKVDRVFMWRSAIGMIRDRPVLGHGLNTFMSNYLDYWVGGERQPRYAHNCYLQVAAETGLMGLALFLVLLGALFWRLSSSLRRLRSPERFLLLGMVAGLAAFAFQAAVDTNFYSVRQAALFWILAGLALGASESMPWPSS